VAKSQDLSAAWTLTVSLLLLTLMGSGMMQHLVSAGAYYFGNFSTLAVNESTVQSFTLGVLAFVGRVTLPFMIGLMIAGVAVNLVQVGFLLTTKPLEPKLEKLNVFQGMQRFLSLRSLAELIKSILKLIIVGYLAYSVLRERWFEVLSLSNLMPYWMMVSVGGIVFEVWLKAVLAMIVIGALDYAFQYWRRYEDLRMTQQEAREESKQLEGDPHVRRRIREVQRRIAFQRMMREVPEADVVVTNPTRFAVALRYDMENMDAPAVVAKGARLIAEKIRTIAEEHDVPIVEQPELARSLYKNIEVGQQVPESLFRAVADVLAFVYQIDRRRERARERQEAMRRMHEAPVHA